MAQESRVHREQNHKLTRSSNTNRSRHRLNLRVLQQTRMRRESGIDPPAGGKQAERVAAAVAVARGHDLVDARRRRPQVGHRRREDGVRRGRPVGQRELGRVEPRRGEVHGRRVAGEHVGRDDEEAGAGEGIGETGWEEIVH